jgi:hypothetical protein
MTAMKISRILGPILAVVILLAMTGAHALFGRAQAIPQTAQSAPPAQAAEPVQGTSDALPSAPPASGAASLSSGTPGGALSGADDSGTSNLSGSGAYTVDGAAGNLDGQTISSNLAGRGGVLVQNGGSLTMANASITTTGAQSPAISVGKGGGSITIRQSTASTSGADSPVIASSGSVSATNLNGSAVNGPMVTIQGASSVTLTDSDLSGAGGSGVQIRQAETGDSGSAASFSAVRSKLTTTAAGPFFSVTGARAEATLAGCMLTCSSGVLAQVSGDGQTGGRLTLDAVGQVLSGDVAVDGTSAFSLSLTDGSIYTGAVDGRNQGQSVSVVLDDNSSWTLTADAHVDALTDAKADLSNLQSGGFKLYYDASNATNAWLSGKTYTLQGGGSLTPES